MGLLHTDIHRVPKGSMTHSQNIGGGGVLKRNKVIVTWNDSLWWLTEIVEFITIMQYLIDTLTIYFQKHLYGR